MAAGAAAAVVCFGPAGCGKSTVAAAVAARLPNGTMVEADDLHDEAARAKMAQGEALTDDDRAPWLRRVRDAMADATCRGQSVAVACSALKREYRAVLSEASPGRVVFVHLETSGDELRRRVAARQGHFFPPELVDSQLAVLELDDSCICYDTEANEASAIAELVAAQVLYSKYK